MARELGDDVAPGAGAGRAVDLHPGLVGTSGRSGSEGSSSSSLSSISGSMFFFCMSHLSAADVAAVESDADVAS